jgi:hypothetical protein
VRDSVGDEEYEDEVMAKSSKWKDKICPRCSFKFETDKGDRYCKDCRKAVKSELAASGFLQKTARVVYRSSDQKAANDRESNPWSENAVRSLEGD